MKRLVLLIIRRRLGLKKGQHFRFNEQKSKATYYFDEHGVWKVTTIGPRLSSVSLNWLLDNDCKITIVD